MKLYNNFRDHLLAAVVAIAFIFSIAYIAYVPSQHEFLRIIIPISVAFLCYYYMLRSDKNNYSFQQLLLIALIARFCIIFAVPNLSDDIYRFLWDGRMVQSGLNPYGLLPSETVGTNSLLSQGLYALLNSPNYYTIYPSVIQFINTLSTFVASTDFHYEILIYKLIVVLFEIALLKVLYKFLKNHNYPSKNLFLYALNPLIIIEISHNLHSEGIMILFLIMGLNSLHSGRIYKAAILFSFSIASKLLPLMYIPIILLKQSIKNSIHLVGMGLISLLILFCPIFYQNPLLGLDQLSSLGLYLKKFEFNGSIYYLLRWLGYEIYGYNLIHVLGPILTLAAGAAILIISIRDKSKNITQFSVALLLITTIFLFTSRTVHPWYLSLPIVLCIFTPFRFPIVWSYLICWTYINYSYSVYQENLLIVFIEYLIVLVLMTYEIYLYKKRLITM